MAKFHWPTAAEVNRTHALEACSELAEKRSEIELLRGTISMLMEAVSTAQKWLSDEHVSRSKIATLDLVLSNAQAAILSLEEEDDG